MSSGTGAVGRAALSLSESILLSLTDNEIIDEAEAKGILSDAASAHREAAPLSDGDAREHEQAATILESIRDHGNSVRRVRPVPSENGESAGEHDVS
jgi:hypothetical protein